MSHRYVFKRRPRYADGVAPEIVDGGRQRISAKALTKGGSTNPLALSTPGETGRISQRC